MTSTTNAHRVCIDRIEDGVAVLLFGEAEEVLVPTRMLPAGASEGDWLLLRLTSDSEETEARRRSVEERRRRLGRDDDGGDLNL